MRVPAIEARTVFALSTTSKIGSAKSPGGNPTIDMVPRLCSMPSACEKAAREAAVTSTP